MSAWLTVFIKEVRENARDRRTLASALLYGPLVGPVLFAVMMVFIMGQQRDQAEQVLKLPVIGAERAPNLVAWLVQQGVEVQSAPEDPEAAVREQHEDVVLRIPPSYAEHWSQGHTAPLDLIYDGSRTHAATTVRRTRALLETYGRQIAALRLQVRGIAPEVVEPLAVVDRDLATAQSRTGMLMAMLPYFLILSAFVGGMYLAIDTTSGERERQSLEPLLITPVSRAQIMLGKMLATSAYAGASLMICVAAFVVSLGQIPVELTGFALALPLRTALMIVIVVLPIALLAASTQTVVAAMAKSFREAQTYLQFLVLLPAVPSLVLVVNPMKPALWMVMTPLFGQSALIGELLRGQSVSGAAIVGCSVSTVLVSMLFAALAVRLYQSERLAISG
ncbi:ABC transporter permease [Sinimarinibacterium sp. CAU 1509]|uniref:ABC transporter permease n=1 Tax=Sinimarinibacterium sp. CAU 1509 TaxID=2562283 RepID=UPI0010AC548C|nr:ABC transporter permease [Sinimarinibacterium sp. CAU 1509]TJY61094.1 ABC transporter permease [Sinimarinibacterium sp. CAU 1509]